MESPCECGIEPPGSINHEVSYLMLINLISHKTISSGSKEKETLKNDMFLNAFGRSNEEEYFNTFK